MRKQGSCLEKEIMQGTMPGARRRGRPRTAWVDNIKMWTGIPVEESIRMSGDRDKWRKYVHGVANLRSRTAREQNRTADQNAHWFKIAKLIRKLNRTSLCWASFLGSRHDATRICCWAPAPAVDVDRQLVRDARSYRSISAAGAQQQTCRTPLLLSIDGTDRRTDGHPTVI